jgi:hypothetical protein
MALAQSLQSQEYKFKYQVLEGTWYWTTRVDMSHAAPAYSIADIRSPFGLLRDSIAIPGDVAKAMGDSITELMSAFAPAILLSTSSMTFHLDEGRGFGDPQLLSVTNSGIFGSLLTATLTTSAPYVTVNPDTLGGLGFNEMGTTQVAANSTNLLASDSPIAATIIVQDAQASNSPQVVSLVLVVRPKAHISSTPTALSFFGVAPIAGPFAPIPTQILTVQNSGPAGSNLDFQVVKLLNNSPWLVAYSPISGSLPGGGAQNVTIVVQPPEGTSPGVYQETLRISGYSDNFYIDVPVTLTIS